MKTSFKSTALIAAAFASVLGCYGVSFQVSAERAGVDAARRTIARDVADIRLLEAELRTRARLPELQRWNEQVLALAPPKAEQFLGSPMLLASFAAPAPAVEVAAVVRDAAPVQSRVEAVAYVAGTPAPEPSRIRPAVVAVHAPTPSRTGSAPVPAGVGVDSVLAGMLDAAADRERSGFQKIALR